MIVYMMISKTLHCFTITLARNLIRKIDVTLHKIQNVAILKLKLQGVHTLENMINEKETC